MKEISSIGYCLKNDPKFQKPYRGLIKSLGIFGLILDGYFGISNLQIAQKFKIGEITWWVILKKLPKISTTLLRPLKGLKNFWAKIS